LSKWRNTSESIADLKVSSVLSEADISGRITAPDEGELSYRTTHLVVCTVHKN